MSYTIYPARGIVVRNSDAATVAPAQSVDDPAYVEYVAWVDAGNSPTLGAEQATDPAVRLLTKLGFRRRFTLMERVAVDAAPGNPAFPDNVRAILLTMATDLSMAEEINLDDADVISGRTLLEQLGVIASGRAAEIRA